MAQQIRIWKIENSDNLREIPESKLDFEKRLEKWLLQDIGIIFDDLLIIGSQIVTSDNGKIDILCMDSAGDLVIVELKKNKAAREVIAQVLDYASWVKDLSKDDIDEIFEKFTKGEKIIEDSFKEKFDVDLPETINSHHKMIVVASEIDSASDRILNYLSDEHKVDINAVTFDYFKDENGMEYIANVFLIEPEKVEIRAASTRRSKKRHKLSYDELLEIARKNGVDDLFKSLYEKSSIIFDDIGKRSTMVSFKGEISEKSCSIFNLIPIDSNKEAGLKF